MIFQELIKVDFLDGCLYNTLQNLRHIKILLPKAEKNLHEKLPSIPLDSKLYQFVLQ